MFERAGDDDSGGLQQMNRCEAICSQVERFEIFPDEKGKEGNHLNYPGFHQDEDASRNDKRKDD